MRRLLACVLPFCVVACGDAPAASPEAPSQPLEIPQLPKGATSPSKVTTVPDGPVVKREPQDPIMDLRDPLSLNPPAPGDRLAYETQLGATRVGDTTRPDLLKHLADAELAEGRGDRSATGREWRKKAIAHYQQLANETPTYGQLDEARYYLGLAYEMSNDLSNARRCYYELIMKSPQSKYIPHAYYAFAEMFFNEGKNGDPSKYGLAKQAYTEVTKYPPPNNPLHGPAKDRIAEIKSLQGGP
jgi:tetratricopeptide (TPR) repeat protein